MTDELDPGVCYCGHDIDEHEAGWVWPCRVEGCDCDDYDEDDG